MHLKRMCILSPWDERLYIYELSPFDVGHSECHHILVDILFGKSIHCSEWGIKIPKYNCVSISLFIVLQNFHYMFGCSYVGGIYDYNVYVSLWMLPLSFMKSPSASLFMAFVLKSFFSVVLL